MKPTDIWSITLDRTDRMGHTDRLCVCLVVKHGGRVMRKQLAKETKAGSPLLNSRTVLETSGMTISPVM